METYKLTCNGIDLTITRNEDGTFNKPPLSELTKTGLGSVWLDSCRIPSEDGERFAANLLVSNEALGPHSKYFNLDAWAETFPFLVCPKASKSEREAGCEALPVANNMRVNAPRESEEAKHATVMHNTHSTVKPIKLMAYLLSLGSRPNDIILDPFAGSGTTLVAAIHLGRRFIGCELLPEHVRIAEARIAYAKASQIARN